MVARRPVDDVRSVTKPMNWRSIIGRSNQYRQDPAKGRLVNFRIGQPPTGPSPFLRGNRMNWRPGEIRSTRRESVLPVTVQERPCGSVQHPRNGIQYSVTGVTLPVGGTHAVGLRVASHGCWRKQRPNRCCGSCAAQYRPA